jgi:tetratricopeptide (TPR) repeat protein
MLAVVNTAAAADPTRRALLLGAAFLQREQYILARYQFEGAVALTPTDTEAQAYLAHTLDLLGETVAARQLLEQVLARDPDSALAYHFLGVHHRLVGNVELAQDALWEALTRDPDNAASRVEMAEAFLDLGAYDRAEEWYRGAVAVAPQDVSFHLLLVHFYLDHLYRIEEAGVSAAEAAVALAPADARVYDLLGWAYYLAGRPRDGITALLEALALDPDLVSAHYHLGSAYVHVGEPDQARQHLQRAADLDRGGYYRDRAEAMLNELK